MSTANASLTGKEKRAHEAKRVEALGGKATKSRSQPYHIMMGIKKAAARRELRDREVVCARQTGVAAIELLH